MVRQRRGGVFARGAAACALFAFGNKSLPGRITSARRGKVTREKRSISFHPPPNPNPSFTFYKGNLLSNFPASFVPMIYDPLWLPTNVITYLKRSKVCLGPPPQTPTRLGANLYQVRT